MADRKVVELEEGWSHVQARVLAERRAAGPGSKPHCLCCLVIASSSAPPLLPAEARSPRRVTCLRVR
jgi:hypothetical protein